MFGQTDPVSSAKHQLRHFWSTFLEPFLTLKRYLSWVKTFRRAAEQVSTWSHLTSVSTIKVALKVTANPVCPFASVQFSLVAQLCPILCDPMDCSTPGLPVHHQLPEFTQTHVHWVGYAIQPPHPLSSPFLPPSVFPSIRVFSNESVLHIRWPKDWSFSFNISPSNQYSGLISFRTYWLDLLAVQGTLKSLLQHHSWKASILWCSVFFIVQLSHPYMTTGKTIALITTDLCWQSNVSAF